jgi:uncharacterized membrane protein YkvA (DUF1232 family)
MNTPFDAKGLWAKLSKYAVSLGEAAAGKAVELYYILESPNTPGKAKAVIVAALAYLILPFDSVPDFLPFVGLTDDVAALMAVFQSVEKYSNDEIKAKSHDKMKQWFGAKQTAHASATPSAQA